MRREPSLGAKLSLTLSALFSAIFIVYGVWVYGYYQAKTYADLDSYLDSKAEGIQESIQTYWQTEEDNLARDRVRPWEASKIEASGFERIAKTWIQDREQSPASINSAVKIYDMSGKLIASSPRVDPGIGLSRESYEKVMGGAVSYDTIELRDQPQRAQRAAFRTITLPVRYHGSIQYLVQVVYSLHSVFQALWRLRAMISISLPLIIALTCAAIFWVTRSTVGPVQRMIDKIHAQIGRGLERDAPYAKSLRFETAPGSGREIQELAESFNSMLTRIDGSFESQARFFNDVSHQLKTPLAILKGELETTLKKARSKDEYEGILESNLEEVNRMIGLVGRMLTLARFDSGQVEPRFQEVALESLVLETLADFSALARERGIDLKIESTAATPAVATAAPTIVTDKEKVEQALSALLENALRYSPRGGTVSVRVDLSAEEAAIEVADEGPGIPAGERERIFERFYRGSQAQPGGYGIGLSIARSALRVAGGEICAPEAQGAVAGANAVAGASSSGGALFRITLPLRPAQT
jgi:signal transduction histidine kinase